MNITANPFRITDIQSVTLNGAPRVCFTAHILEGSAYVHIGQFSAPAGTPEHELFGYIQLHGNDDDEEV